MTTAAEAGRSTRPRPASSPTPRRHHRFRRARRPRAPSPARTVARSPTGAAGYSSAARLHRARDVRRRGHGGASAEGIGRVRPEDVHRTRRNVRGQQGDGCGAIIDCGTWCGSHHLWRRGDPERLRRHRPRASRSRSVPRGRTAARSATAAGEPRHVRSVSSGGGGADDVRRRRASQRLAGRRTSSPTAASSTADSMACTPIPVAIACARG